MILLVLPAASKDVLLATDLVGNQGCRSILVKLSRTVKKGVISVVTWPFRTKTRMIISGAGILTLGSLAPIYHTEEGKIAPALEAIYFVRDIAISSSGNPLQSELLDDASRSRGGSELERLSILAQQADQRALHFPQGVRIPPKNKRGPQK